MSVPESLDGHLQLLPPDAPVDGAEVAVAQLGPQGELGPGDRPLVRLDPVWSTLIGRGSTLLRSHWSRAFLVMLAPAILCHKEPARASKAPY